MIKAIVLVLSIATSDP